ncbi:MAG TPA: glutamate-cysteine ligase family protein [Sphingomonadaceae bacterium]|nr:glutamate-cysteine ligase family protein [Sphingomonadaceae bacterium]
MGQEISSTGFAEADFRDFRARVAQETGLLRAAYETGKLSRRASVIGLELEAWLVDHNGYPAPHNQSFLERVGDPQVVAELSRFNIELNAPPRLLAGEGLLELEQGLRSAWDRCDNSAHDLVDTIIAIGTLPTLREADLTLANMTPLNRYEALNREVLKARKGEPIRFDIDSVHAGGKPLKTVHHDVMIEAATTSFQLHWQLPPERMGPVMNASSILSAPLVALAANSPFLFGRKLWHETRIAIFEQAVSQPGDGPQRVTFGRSYVAHDPIAIFEDNLALYPPLLPFMDDEEPGKLACLRLHNGTIWRWNRPLVGFDEDGTPHLRIEQRVMPSGPTAIDMLANGALYYGAAHMLAERMEDPERLLPFDQARANFYACARHGLDAEIAWLDGRSRPVRQVIEKLVPLAREGLAAQGVSDALAERYLDVVLMRCETRQNGAAWQLRHHAKHGDLARLVADYLAHQRSGNPVHEWELD